MLMCLVAALTGVIVFLRKQSLLGESLSHAAYPGVIIGVLTAAFFDIDDQNDVLISIFIIAGAFLSALAGLWCIHFLERKWKVSSDAALCFILSSFFGIGLTLASRIQFTHTYLYKQSLSYLYGQAATMTDWHVVVYGVLSVLIITMILLLYKELHVISLDRGYAKSLGIPVKVIDTLTFIVIVLAVVIGIRSVGVVLMSAMLIATPAAARQYTHRLNRMLVLAAIFGLASGFFGNYLSIEAGQFLAEKYPQSRLNLPTGPMIVMVAAAICVFSLLFAPERGLLLRLIRIVHFRYKCLSENILKNMWRFDRHVTFEQMTKYQSVSKIYLHWIVRCLIYNGWVIKTASNSYQLTHDGFQRAGRIVRLHRLWEVYLADYLGVGVEKVHHSAEEMEHIITPEIEQELTRLLNDPKRDPHHQPIPSIEDTISEEEV